MAVATFASLEAALQRVAVAADRGSKAACNAMTTQFTRDVRDVLKRQHHPFATRTPSPPGAPPAMISGALADSVIPTRAAGGGGYYRAMTGPTVRYARIQELGGEMQGHPLMHWWQDGVQYYSVRHSLPRRPYMLYVHDRDIADGVLHARAAAAFEQFVLAAI